MLRAAVICAICVLPQVSLADSCFVTPARLSVDAIGAFTSDPQALLDSNPAGGYGLTSEVRRIAGSETDALGALVGLADGASPIQIAALGAGLAQAAVSCVTIRPDIAQQIQEAVAATGNEALITAFAAASGNTQTAALGATGATGGTGAGQGGAIGGTAGAAGATGDETGGTSGFQNGVFSLSANGATGSITTTVSEN